MYYKDRELYRANGEEIGDLGDEIIPHLADCVYDAEAADLYINIGADFIVSPVVDGQVAEVCNRRKILWIPGCLTPTGISRAETLKTIYKYRKNNYT